VGDDAGTDAVGPPAVPLSSGPPTVEAATVFVHYWFDVLNYAGRTGRTDELETASSPECAECAALLQRIRDSASGAPVTGYEIREARGSFWSVDHPWMSVVYDRGDPDASFLSCQVVLERVGDHWRVRHILSNQPLA